MINGYISEVRSNMECVHKCEFQEFDGEGFGCKLYETDLTTIVDESKLKVIRCQECVNEALIGTNSKGEFLRKTRQHLGWLADSFYTLKDDMEEELSHIYRLIKEYEEDEEVYLSEITRDHERKPDEISEKV
jgi:hypothetical protein